MTQHLDHPIPSVRPEHIGPGTAIPEQRRPEPGVPPWGYAPPIPPEEPRPRPGRTRMAVSGAVAVVLVIATVIGAVLFGSAEPPAAAPAVAPIPTPALSVPAGPAPSVTPPQVLAARQQMLGATLRFALADSTFGRQGKAAMNAHDRKALRAAIIDFRQATVEYDASLRAISFPAAQQDMVTSQLLPATGALIADLDELARLDAGTLQATAQRATDHLQRVHAVSQQVQAGL